MRAIWEALRKSLGRSIRDVHAFTQASSRRPELGRFSTSEELVGYLTSNSGDLDEKDRILAALVTMVQRGEDPRLAAALLWLGLWPGLDCVYRRCSRHFRSQPAELASEIGDAFTSIIGRLDLKAVSRVAATLVRGTERDVMDRWRRQLSENARVQYGADAFHDFMQHCMLGEDPSCQWTCSQPESVLGLLPGLSFEQNMASLFTRLQAVVGEDAELLIAVFVLDETQLEAGERLGLSHDAARKRFQRALGRLRDCLDDGA